MAYLLATLVLFQFASFKIAVGLYENPVARSPAVVDPNVAQETTNINAQAAKDTETAMETVGLPVRIKIASIHVDAAIRAVGLAADGSMDAPELPHDAAWYKFGPKPGEKGSAVIDGHFDWWYGENGVFKHLDDLKPGDMITVQDAQGTNTIFAVKDSRAYDPNADTKSVFHSNDGKAHLNLITCAGTWDKEAKMYSKRLIVFAEKVVE
jgi:LPXTG-site transpeptidase (sortase) family protein